MSYLLTEIALDMLGYKFYDVNGVFHITDFQTTPNNDDNENQEPPLEDIIYPNGLGRIAESNSSDSDECVEISNSSVLKTSANRNELVKLNIKESVEKEIENLREEIYYNKAKFIKDNLKVIKKRDKSSKITPNDLLKPYNEREKKNIQNEAQLLGEFLKCVEKRLEEANPQLFKDHKRYRMEEFLL